MRDNSVKLTIHQMIKRLNEISSGGVNLHKIYNGNNNSKLAFLFKQKLNNFYYHFLFTQQLIMKETEDLTDKYKELFRNTLKSIFKEVFKIKIIKMEKNKKIFKVLRFKKIDCKLYMRTVEEIENFMMEEKSRFNIGEIMNRKFFGFFSNNEKKINCCDKTENLINFSELSISLSEIIQKERRI